MGLIQIAKDSVTSVIQDQFLEYFSCESMPNDCLMRRGRMTVTQGRNGNTKNSDNIITNGSVIAVNPGQCMLIVNQGQIEEVCAEPGAFKYDGNSEPSIFAGNLGENIIGSFKNMGRRFAFGGNTARDQRVYFINTKEIMNNLYGTPTPIDFHLCSPNTGLELEAEIKANGQYSFKIVDPILFFTNVCANISEEEFNKKTNGADMMSMMKSELLTKLPMAVAPIGAKGVLPSQLQGHVGEIIDNLKSELTYDWTETRGIEVVNITITASVPEKYKEKINEFSENVAIGGDFRYQQAANVEVTRGQAEMLRNFKVGGSDGKGGDPMGAMMGMMAMNMMNNNMPGGQPQQQMYNQQMYNQQMYNQQPMGQQMYGQPMGQQMQQPMQQPMQPASQAVAGGWTCSCGHAGNTGKFCMECGSPKPEANGWTCNCGTVNTGKFCMNCGNKKPAGAPLYKCDKCGWVPEDP